MKTPEERWAAMQSRWAGDPGCPDRVDSWCNRDRVLRELTEAQADARREALEEAANECAEMVGGHVGEYSTAARILEQCIRALLPAAETVTAQWISGPCPRCGEYLPAGTVHGTCPVKSAKPLDESRIREIVNDEIQRNVEAPSNPIVRKERIQAMISAAIRNIRIETK